MSISLEPVLMTIIPTITGSLPPRLLETAHSLLLQSRQKVTNLRPEEEIARAYVCARIACERLKTSLDLPPLNQKKLPLPKAAYTRLHQQFVNALPERASRKRDAQSNQPASSSSANPSYHPSITHEVESAARTLCQKTGVPEATDTILQGLSYVLETELPHRTSNEKFDIPTALVSIRRLYFLKQLDETPPVAYQKEKVSEYMKALGDFGKSVKITRAMKLSGEWVAACESWKWWRDITAGGVVPGVGGLSSAGRKRKRSNFESGIGSMLRNEFEFLSEKRRKAYAQWKVDTLKRIEQLEVFA